MTGKYILKNREAVVEPDLLKWGRWFEKGDKRVGETMIGDVRVSTVFLGLDHNFGDGPPLLFETMVFGGELDQEMDRCSTWAESVIMHDNMCKRVKGN